MEPSPAAVRRARLWARGALRLESGSSWTPDAAPEPPDDLLAALRRHRLVALVGTWPVELRVPSAVAGPLAALRAAERRSVTVQVLEIARLQGLLDAAGVEFLVIKGPALAVQSARDRAARGPGDIDLLISPERVDDVHRLLLGRGWGLRPESGVTPGTWAWGHVQRSFNALTYDGPGSTVDLHWRLDPTLDALPTFAEVWQRRQLIDLGGVQVPTLGSGDLLGHTSLHAAKDSWRWMRSLVDVHRLAAAPATWDRVAADGRLRRLEIGTLAVTRSTLGLPAAVPLAVLDQLDEVSPAVVERALRAQDRPVYATYPFPGLESARLLRYMVSASSTPRDVAHALVGTVLPVKTVVGVESRSARTGVPLALGRRVGRARRRGVSWVRRQPGAGVVDPLVTTR